MVAGANWAYVELGWGGFWAWDPVENTALMPWLAATVFLHTSRMEESTGRWRRWNVFFAGLPFALSVMGVYLTRSGATGSIHSFAEDPVVGRVLLVSAVVLAAVVALSAARSPAGAPWRAIRLDHSGWLGVNALLVTAVLVFVTAGSAYPAFVSVFADESIVVDSRFFVLTVLPVAMLIAVSIGAALRARMPIAAGIGVLTLALALLAAGLRPGVFLLAPALASFVVIGLRLVEKRPRGRILTAHLAHLGMALFLVGVAGSSLGEDFSGSMMPGDAVVVAGHEIVLEDVRTGESERFVFVRAGFTVDGERLEPEIRAYEDQASPVAEPVLRSTVVADVIVAVSLLFPDGNTVAVSVFVRPLVWLVWAGALLMGLAGLVALSSRAGDGARRRRGATEARQPEGTTSGTASP
jgi:cytochrome c-type biogenesis protein CcmF